MMDEVDTVLPRPASLARYHRWTVRDYHRMGELGLLGPDARVELIEGQIIDMAPIGGAHVSAVISLNALLTEQLGRTAWVSVRSPLRLDDHSEPEPDLAVLRRDGDRYTAGVPEAHDTLLVIEVADSSLAHDREVKRPLYARSGVAELWIVDLAAGVVEVCRSPWGDAYTDVSTVNGTGVVQMALVPGVTIPVSAFLA